MKVQCSCGARYEFELRPEMRERPVQFICPSCGLDASAFVDEMVRRELGQSASPAGTPVPVLQPGVAMTPEAPQSIPLARPVPGIKLQRHSAAAEPLEATIPEPDAPTCPKHPGQPAIAKCYICSKPICPRCMELFGYVCSPLCKAKAESHGIKLPVYEGQKSVREAHRWRKLVWAASSAAAVLILLLGLWFWYAWFGREPKPIFSVRFPEPAYSGQSAVGGKQNDQLVFLHGALLARYDLNSGKEVWTRRVVDQKTIDQAVAAQQRATQVLINRADSEGSQQVPRSVSQADLAKEIERDATAALSLYVRGQNIWLTSPGKITQYDWKTGEPGKELPARGQVLSRDNELLLVDTRAGSPIITHLDLETGAVRTESLGNGEAGIAVADAVGSMNIPSNGKPGSGQALTGLPATPTANAPPMDPAKVADQAQHMALPKKLALPAVLAANMNQQRALKEMDDSDSHSAASHSALQPTIGSTLVPSKDGFVELSVKLLESKIVTRSAMKPGSGQSALNRDVTAGNSMELSGEMLNEMQRENGGDLVQEDHSRYEVTLRQVGSGASWTGEVTGRPKVYPLDSVNVLAADKLIIVFNKACQKLWQSPLSYNIVPGLAGLDEASATYGQGPCVERNGTLYVFDQGVLACFDLATGNARWRLPSVGIVGLFFDDQGMVYVNTTTASHESLKYSRQIDLSQKVGTLILKLDSRNGQILWSAHTKGLVNYVWGKFILAAQSSIPDEDDSTDTQTERRSWMRIRRLSASNGRELWQLFQERAPLDIAFAQNTIRLVFKKEVQVLRFPRF